MRIERKLANQIHAKARAILDRDVLVADPTGKILAGELGHGKFAAEAMRACQEGRQISGPLGEPGSPEVRWWPLSYEDSIIGAFGMAGAGSQATPEAVSLLQGLVEVIIHQHFLLDHIQSTSVIQADFIKEVLQSANINPPEIFRQADILQINLHSPQAAMLIRLDGFEAKLHAKTSNLSDEEQQTKLGEATEKINKQIREAFKGYQDNITAYLGGDTFALLKGIGGENLNTMNTIRFMMEKGQYIFSMLQETQRDYTVTVGVGQYYLDLGGLRKSYQDAKLALEVGIKVWGTGQVYHIKSVGMFVTLAHISQDRKAELAHQILNPLLRDQQLFKTVQVFLASGLNLTEAANKLHVHRNTLIYRLDKTRKLIALDPRHFDDALQIKLGLMFY